jgi:hypothetical protein
MHEATQGWERGRLVRIRPMHVIPDIEDHQRFSRFALSADGMSAFPATAQINASELNLSHLRISSFSISIY